MSLNLQEKMSSLKKKIFKNNLRIHAQELFEESMIDTKLSDFTIRKSYEDRFDMDDNFKESCAEFFTLSVLDKTITQCIGQHDDMKLSIIKNMIDNIDFEPTYESYFFGQGGLGQAKTLANIVATENVDEFIYDFMKMDYEKRVKRGKRNRDIIKKNLSTLKSGRTECDIELTKKEKIEAEKIKAEISEIYQETKENNDPVLFHTYIMQSDSTRIQYAYSTLLALGITDTHVISSLISRNAMHLSQSYDSPKHNMSTFFGIKEEDIEKIDEFEFNINGYGRPFCSLDDEEIVNLISQKYLSKEKISNLEKQKNLPNYVEKI